MFLLTLNDPENSADLTRFRFYSMSQIAGHNAIFNMQEQACVIPVAFLCDPRVIAVAFEERNCGIVGAGIDGANYKQLRIHQSRHCLKIVYLTSQNLSSQSNN